jgi:hypothetical protein
VLNSLALKCPSKAHGLVPSLALLRDGETFNKWGLVGILLVIGSIPLKEIVDPSPFLFLFSLVLGLELRDSHLLGRCYNT